MGYEIKLIVGKRGYSMKEVERDLTKPYEDGSGFEYKKDEKGNYIYTGRNEIYFQIMGIVELCKIGDGPLSKVVSKSHKLGNEFSKVDFVLFYGFDGDEQFSEDKYGDYSWPVPVKEVCAALSQELSEGEDYRRFVWALALLNSMKNDSEQLEVIFWGH